MDQQQAYAIAHQETFHRLSALMESSCRAAREAIAWATVWQQRQNQPRVILAGRLNGNGQAPDPQKFAAQMAMQSQATFNGARAEILSLCQAMQQWEQATNGPPPDQDGEATQTGE